MDKLSEAISGRIRYAVFKAQRGQTKIMEIRALSWNRTERVLLRTFVDIGSTA